MKEKTYHRWVFKDGIRVCDRCNDVRNPATWETICPKKRTTKRTTITDEMRRVVITLSKNHSQIYIAKVIGLSAPAVSNIINQDQFIYKVRIKEFDVYEESDLMSRETISYRELYRPYGNCETVGRVII